MYFLSPPDSFTVMRRSIRRMTVFLLYVLKSLPVADLSSVYMVARSSSSEVSRHDCRESPQLVLAISASFTGISSMATTRSVAPVAMAFSGMGELMAVPGF